MASLAFPSLDARFIDVPGAVEITQRGRTYRARDWQLTPELVEIIHAAVDSGFGCFWVNGHPSVPYFFGNPKFQHGSHHITFSRSHEERWVFVVDGSSKPPSPIDVTFNKGLRDFLERVGESHQWEHSGGHNLRVARARLSAVLALLDSSVLDGLQHRMIRETYVGALPVLDIYDETQLQLKIEALWLPLLRQANCRVSSRRMIDGWIPDLLIETPDGRFVVVELKFSHAGGVEVDQVRKYLQLPTLLQNAKGLSLRGVLIARDFSEAIISANASNSAPISFYSFGQRDGLLRLALVSGGDVLQEVGLNSDVMYFPEDRS